MKFYLDEDISPKIAEILRQKGIEAKSAHETGMIGASDFEQLSYAASKNYCMVTRNRNDFIQLTIIFFNENRPHSGLLIITNSYAGDQFQTIAEALKKYALTHKKGISSYGIDFLTK